MNMILKIAEAIRLRDTTDESTMARAALEAMLEPTEEMQIAAFGARPYIIESEFNAIWKAAIKTALKE